MLTFDPLGSYKHKQYSHPFHSTPFLERRTVKVKSRVTCDQHCDTDHQPWGTVSEHHAADLDTTPAGNWALYHKPDGNCNLHLSQGVWLRTPTVRNWMTRKYNLICDWIRFWTPVVITLWFVSFFFLSLHNNSNNRKEIASWGSWKMSEFYARRSQQQSHNTY